MLPDISVLIPARNEQSAIAETIQAIARARTTGARVEFVVVDDASTDDCVASLVSAVPELLEERKIDIRVCRLERHSGTYVARNCAAEVASGDIFFITDAHVQFSTGWDQCVLDHVGTDRVLAATVTQEGTGFRGYGCKLLVPLMRTSWNADPGEEFSEVPIAVCSATVIHRSLFEKLGGYDPGMIQYGGGEAEFSVRAWLHGAQVCCLRELEVQHEFKTPERFADFMSGVRLYLIHNCMRFGLLYLSEAGCLQLLRYYARAFPAYFQAAVAMVHESDVWERRALLEGQRQREFSWFVDHFGLRNQVGGEII